MGDSKWHSGFEYAATDSQPPASSGSGSRPSPTLTTARCASSATLTVSHPTTRPHSRLTLPPAAPWPSWAIASRTGSDDDAVKAFLAALEPYVVAFNSPEARAGPDVDFVEKTFGQMRADVVEWLATVKWAEHLAEISEDVLCRTLHGLGQAGVVAKHVDDKTVGMFINTNVAKIVE